MYFQSDYILRMIQMMGDFFNQLLAMVDEAIKQNEYDRFVNKHCGISGEMANSLEISSLLDMLPDDALFALSELFYVRKKAFELDDDEAEETLYKSLRMLLKVGNRNLLCEMRKERMLELYNTVYDRLTAEDLAAVFSFLVLADDYAKAEDVLFDALDTVTGEAAAMLLRHGIVAFERLNAQNTDSELARGGLPREELLQAINELKQKQELNA